MSEMCSQTNECAIKVNIYYFMDQIMKNRNKLRIRKFYILCLLFAKLHAV